MMTESQTCVSSIQITSIKRIGGKAILVLSDGTRISMPRAMLRERPYRSGMPFDRTSFNLFLRERSYSFAIEKAVGLLAARSRTEKEIEDYLRRNAYPETTVARVMARLYESGYLNDSTFAANWTASRNAKGLGERRIRMELRQKGVASSTIDAALSNLDDSAVLASAIKTAEKASCGRDLSSPADRQKIIAALARRGFDFSTAKQALQHVIDQSE